MNKKEEARDIHTHKMHTENGRKKIEMKCKAKKLSKKQRDDDTANETVCKYI